ncbi:MAG: hypothetical protein ACRC7G_11605 [Beijerinckiaceae bacterium]
MNCHRQTLLFLAAVTLGAPLALAQADMSQWPPLVNPFESTGGGGYMIDGYRPIVSEGRCLTDFSVKDPAGPVFQNEASFDAVPRDGGIWCMNGRWRAKDGSAQGTTPFEMFIKDGVVRRKPA